MHRSKVRGWLVVAAVAGNAAWIGGCGVLIPLEGLSGGDAGFHDAEVPSDSWTAVDAGTDPGDGTNIDSVASWSSAPTEAAPPDDGSGSVSDATACVPPAPASLDACTAIGSLPAAPVIDGVLDCGVPLWPMPVVVSSGPGKIPSTVRATIGAAWRPDGIYLFVSVTGAGPNRYPAPAAAPAWCGDAIELFVDQNGAYTNPPQYDDPGTIQLVASAPPNANQPTSAGETFRDAKPLGPYSGQFVSNATSDGFTTEAFVTAADLGLASWSLTAGGKVGLDVSVDLGSPAEPASCPRLAQFTVQLPKATTRGCGPACDVLEFCTPVLEP